MFTCSLFEVERIKAYLPTSLALGHTRRHLEQTIRTVPCHNLFYRTSWASDLLAVFTKQEVLERVEGEIGAWGPGVECSFLLLVIVVLGLCAAIYWRGDVGTGAADEGVWEAHTEGLASVRQPSESWFLSRCEEPQINDLAEANRGTISAAHASSSPELSTFKHPKTPLH